MISLDTEGVKGIDNKAAWLYLEGNFEEAMKELKQEHEEANVLKSCIEERSALILSSHLKRPDLVQPLDQILKRDSLEKCLLLIDAKTDAKLLNDDHVTLWDLLTLCHRSQYGYSSSVFISFMINRLIFSNYITVYVYFLTSETRTVSEKSWN